MANGVDTDQTAPPDLGLYCLHMPSLSDSLVCEILRHLPYGKDISVVVSGIFLVQDYLPLALEFLCRFLLDFHETLQK